MGRYKEIARTWELETDRQGRKSRPDNEMIERTVWE